MLDRGVVRFPAVLTAMIARALRLPPGRVRRTALSWMLRRAYAAYDRGDQAVTFAALAEDVEWHLPADLPGEVDVLRGRDAVTRWYGELAADWNHRIRLDRIEDHGDGRVSVHATNVLTSEASGLSFQFQDNDELHFRDGRIALVRERPDDRQGNPWRGLTA